MDNQIGQERLGTKGLQLCDNSGASLTVPGALTLLGAKLELAKQPDLPSHTLSVLLSCRVEKAVLGVRPSLASSVAINRVRSGP